VPTIPTSSIASIVVNSSAPFTPWTPESILLYGIGTEPTTVDTSGATPFYVDKHLGGSCARNDHAACRN
jgi:hypothetical protein